MAFIRLIGCSERFFEARLFKDKEELRLLADEQILLNTIGHGSVLGGADQVVFFMS